MNLNTKLSQSSSDMSSSPAHLPKIFGNIWGQFLLFAPEIWWQVKTRPRMLRNVLQCTDDSLFPQQSIMQLMEVAPLGSSVTHHSPCQDLLPHTQMTYPGLWSIPSPEHSTFLSCPKKSLYHNQCALNLERPQNSLL